ncbi:MAG: PLP-dependent aminotransferase family protein, partial [Thermodesulfobacteriota bacterium]|nr:PLP-dependent aminotransferase family protein [Thermodesulfobacteriota bacterium]
MQKSNNLTITDGIGMKEQVSHKMPEFLYLKLAEELEGKIQTGNYRAGEKLPSLRNLHTRSGLSISTVYQAYMELEKKGIVEAKEKSGFYVKPLMGSILPLPRFRKSLVKPRSPSVNSLAESIYGAIGGSDMLPLGAALPSPEILPVKQLTNSSRAVAGEYLQDGGIGYGPLIGVAELSRQIRNRAIGYIGDVDEEEIVITNGCMEAIDLCLRSVSGPGDTIVVESPSFVCYLQLIEDLNLMVLEAPTDPDQGIDLESLFKMVEKHDVKACLLNPNFQNPLGYEMSGARKERLVEFLSEKEVPLIEDDIYGDLYFGKSRPGTCKSFDKKGLVLYCSSF